MSTGNSEPDDVSVEAITRALTATRARITSAERQRAELDRIIAAGKEEERLLDRLLALRRNASSIGAPESGAVQARVHERLPSRNGAGHAVLLAVIDELEAAGRPLHISELMRLLRERKATIPGSGTQANLITYLRRDERLVRPSRGMYGLKAWGLESMEAPHRRRRKRTRMRSTASIETRTKS